MERFLSEQILQSLRIIICLSYLRVPLTMRKLYVQVGFARIMAIFVAVIIYRQEMKTPVRALLSEIVAKTRTNANSLGRFYYPRLTVSVFLHARLHISKQEYLLPTVA